jgi:hypothetical protein
VKPLQIPHFNIHSLLLMLASTENKSLSPTLVPGTSKNQSQVQFIRPAQMSLFSKVTCYPPLGQVTCPQRIQHALGSEKEDTV